MARNNSSQEMFSFVFSNVQDGRTPPLIMWQLCIPMPKIKQFCFAENSKKKTQKTPKIVVQWTCTELYYIFYAFLGSGVSKIQWLCRLWIQGQESVEAGKLINCWCLMTIN